MELSMKVPISFLIPFLALLSVPLLTAEEVVLKYEKSEGMPFAFAMAEEVEDAADGWQKGADLLPDNAVTLLGYLEAGDMDEEGVLLSVATLGAKARLPDTLFIDCNRNSILEENEKFSFGPLEGQEASGLCCATKIPLSVNQGEKPIFTNLYMLCNIIPEEEEVYYLFALSAWGCCKGELTLEGESHELILIDHNVNGSFCDFVSGSEQYPAGDTFQLMPAGSPGHVQPMPLRQKLFRGKTAYSVTVKENGLKVVLAPVDVEFGSVVAKRQDIEVTLNHPEWGDHVVAAGNERYLPKGSWTIRRFRIVDKETFAFCDYSGPESVKLTLKPGKKAAIELDTAFKATVQPRYSRGKIQLNLQLATAQGARFSSYYGGVQKDKVESGELGQFLEGIPFKITNEAGKEAHKGLFEFG